MCEISFQLSHLTMSECVTAVILLEQFSFMDLSKMAVPVVCPIHYENNLLYVGKYCEGK